ncbi:MAG: nickel pincer cofactor biosynthesis protein LarC [Clostridium sp.]|uniref:nickel pincer cofactor biosynthesis protein LarC n=1 Tax=Clostridium sp. TaxID=1506 RepID=UPI0025BDF5CC|nr:nickel pincer cofactor biosynthesis protein LarC [Clostridium sp.]MCE5222209.1 nickel pincer cofactor biosynthesis protein LarC [Clostridium sp.]
MKVLYYDCFCGISGDMNLAALLDLGVPKEYLIEEISKLNLDSEYEIKINKAEKHGITGTRVDVILKNQTINEGDVVEKVLDNHHQHKDEHVHENSNHHIHDSTNEECHTHEHINEKHHDHEHNHPQDGNHTHTNNHEHHHRNLKDIENIINSSALKVKVKKLSMDMFMKVAEAEAKVHGKTLYEVHFHEVGAIDSIIDMVGAAICIDYLEVDKIIASPVQVGGGFVKCAHGLMPVPAPATVEILKNIPINTGIVPFETTTPTGAAILAANVQEFTPKIDFSIKKVAYGIGHRDLEIPNVLRVYLGEEETFEKIEEQYILDTNIDDMNPEFYGYVEEKLFEKGALDVFKTAIFMKKGRLGVKLSVLVNEQCEKSVLDVIFEETTSIGVRKYKVEKIMLNREFSKVKTQYGDITIKKSYYKGKLIKYKPEYEECRSIAKEKNITLGKVYKEVSDIEDSQY